MKKYLFFLITLSAAYACGNRVCTINGTITDPVDSVRLVDMSGAILDASAVTDGAFTLKCNLNPQTGVSVVRGDRYEPISLIPDSKEIIISMSDGKPVVSGSPLSEELQDLQQWTMNTFMEYGQKAFALMEAGDKEGADSVNAETYKIVADRCREIYKKHKSDPLGNQAMVLMMHFIDKDEFFSLYEQGGKIIKDDAMIGGYYEHLKSLPSDNVITLSDNGDIETSNGSFEDYVGAGKYTLVDFWASWCGPCKKETPYVTVVFEKYRDKGLVVIGVPVNDKKEATVKAMKELGIHYPQVLDPSQALAGKFGITGIPHIMLFSPDGIVLEEGLRGEGIEEAVKKVL
ncbi:MAG: AhpC/TSA family protein [Bacteroidales bacterium]|nr:AhpC/TSA family protein [Bacteroidales bacterium]